MQNTSLLKIMFFLTYFLMASGYELKKEIKQCSGKF